MEQSEFETLKPSNSLPPFPPHRRRHLNSETYRTLVRILSHSCDESQRPHANQAVPEEPKRGNGLNELWQANEQEMHDELTGPTSLGSENLSIESSEAHMEIDELDNVNRIEGNKELIHNNGMNLAVSLEEKNPSSSAVALTNNQEDQFSVREIHMEESGNTGKQEVDEKQYSCKVTEALDLSLDIDIIAEYSIPHENNGEKSYSMERNVLEEVAHEMRGKEMELDKSVSTSGAMNSPICVIADDEIEEGEISGDFGIYDQSMDRFLEHAESLEAKKVDEEQTSKDIIDKEEFIRKEQKGANEKNTKSNTNSMGTVNTTSNGADVELRESNRIEKEYKSEMVVHGKTTEAKKVDEDDCVLETGRNIKQGSGVKKSTKRPAACPENLALHSKISGENAAENQGTMSTEKGAGVCNKKRKGPLTKERRAKKKQKERIKRAEVNRKLGVKRLKLQPVSKPKTVTYCRHYLKGRCQEGDKCKFSHDTIPLTKSKPCGHFARHTCMKGDDCPFDHQLSKYPCNNYVSKGSCSRGADCMFSHEIPLKEGSPVASNVSEPKLKSLSQLSNSNSKKQLNIHGTSHQNVDAKSCSIGISPRKNTEQNVAETSVKPAAQAPKGISFLSFGKSSLGDTRKYNQAGSSPKADDGVKVGRQMIHSASDIVRNSSETTKRTAGVAPQGINFLSFGKAPLDDSISKKSSSLTSDRDYGIGKSPLGDSSKDKQAVSSPKRDVGVKFGDQSGQSQSDMVWNLNEIPKRIPAVGPLGINSLSFGKAPLDDSSNKKQASLPSSGDNGVASSVQERPSASDKHRIPSAMPWRLPSPSLPSGQSLDQLAAGHGKNTPTSAQKALLSNTPSSAQKALLSTLAFAAKYESGVKMERSIGVPAGSTDFNKETSSSQNKSLSASMILDFLYGDGSKIKQ